MLARSRCFEESCPADIYSIPNPRSLSMGAGQRDSRVCEEAGPLLFRFMLPERCPSDSVLTIFSVTEFFYLQPSSGSCQGHDGRA